MNILYLTQASSLRLFHDLSVSMRSEIGEGRDGFYVSDSEVFENLSREIPALVSNKYEIVKEWENLSQAAHIETPDLEYLRQAEIRLGDPTLWNAIVSDRRLFLGKRATLSQDYSKRFTQTQLLAILEVTIREIESQFDRLQPKLVVGFICVSIGEYIASLVAKARGIPLINLRPTRVRNYFYAGENVHEPSPLLGETYQTFLKTGIAPDLLESTKNYLQEVRSKHAMYEGVIPPPSKESHGTPLSATNPRRFPNVSRFLRRAYRYRFTEFKYDTHFRGLLFPLWFTRVIKPLRLWNLRRTMDRHYVQAHELSHLDFAFFPLHKEPEVTLLVYSRPYLNQVEVIKNLARSLPTGMCLLVKEHPAGMGYRPTSFYRSLLEIPNVRIADPSISSRELIQKTKLVAVISGSIGLEAAILGKPVIVLGNAPFNWLSTSMLRHPTDLQKLPNEVFDLLNHYQPDEESLQAFIAATIHDSVAVDFYSKLLNRAGVFEITKASNASDVRREHLKALANYIIKIYKRRSRST